MDKKEAAMNWEEVCADPHLQDLPYRIELNERGQILMSPVRLYHSAFQGKIIKYLNQLLAEGEAFPKLAIATEKGTKVADVVYCSDTLLAADQTRGGKPHCPGNLRGSAAIRQY
jgi:hypothetical protein